MRRRGDLSHDDWDWDTFFVREQLLSEGVGEWDTGDDDADELQTVDSRLRQFFMVLEECDERVEFESWGNWKKSCDGGQREVTARGDE